MKHSNNPIWNLFFFFMDSLGLWISKKDIFNSRSLKQTYCLLYRLNPAKCEVVPNHIENRFRLSTVQRESWRKNLGVTDRVIFRDWKKRPEKWIAASDAFVFPGRYEGMPNALLEALSCCMPCLGSRILEIEEVLKFDQLLFSLRTPGNTCSR